MWGTQAGRADRLVALGAEELRLERERACGATAGLQFLHGSTGREGERGATATTHAMPAGQRGRRIALVTAACLTACGTGSH